MRVFQCPYCDFAQKVPAGGTDLWQCEKCKQLFRVAGFLIQSGIRVMECTSDFEPVSDRDVERHRILKSVMDNLERVKKDIEVLDEL